MNILEGIFYIVVIVLVAFIAVGPLLWSASDKEHDDEDESNII
jgi:nitrogen fixation-related uncharacterized protein